MYKICTKCGKVKHTCYFHESYTYKDGLNIYCKPCASLYQKERRQRIKESPSKGPKYHKEFTEQFRREIKDRIQHSNKSV